MNDKPKMEITRTIYPAGGEAKYYNWEVVPDGDGLGCVELRYIENEPTRKIVSRIAVPPAVAALIAKAFLACSEELESTAK